MKVMNLLQFAQDPGHRSGFEFRVERRQLKSDFSALGNRLDLPLEFFDGPVSQPLQDGDGALLPKISHSAPLLPP
jgi:hypothetical protein